MLAEKGIEYETVLVDLDERPDWIVALNPPDGRVPVLEQPGQPLLPESRIVMRYLDERFPEPPLMPDSPEERALVDLALERFDSVLSAPYYRVKNGRASAQELDEALAALDRSVGAREYLVGSSYSLADIAYVPWLIRAEVLLGADVRAHASLRRWLTALEQREAIRAELELVGGLAV